MTTPKTKTTPIPASRDPRYASDPKGWMVTKSGRAFWPCALEPRDVELEDVAHALSNLCRFAGNTRSFYSVAQHSTLAAVIVMHRTGDPLVAFAALMHDAPEAFLIDLPRPIKRRPELAAYLDFEELAERAVAHRFGFDPNLFAHPEVKRADALMLALERRDLIETGQQFAEEHAIFPDLGDAFVIDPLPPHLAYRTFMHKALTLAIASGVTT